MDDSDDYITITSENESVNVRSVNFPVKDGPTPKSKGKKAPNSKSQMKSKIRVKKIKCDRQDEHRNPQWMNSYKPLYGPPLISSFLVIDIQKIFRSKFSLPLLDRITRSEGIDLLAELLGMYDLEINIISYWTLDVLSQVIRKCQSASMIEDNIKMCILWIHYILYTIHKNRPTRKKLFKHLCIMFNRAMWQLPEITAIPHPYHIKQEMDKQRSKKTTSHIPEKKVEFSNTTTNQDEEPRREPFEKGVVLTEEFEGLEEDCLKEDSGDDSQKESSSEEEDKSEEEELEPEEGNEEDFSDSSIENESQEEVTEELHYLPDEANDLPDEIKEKLYFIVNNLAKIRKTNEHDFFLLIKIIYRIFANRFKYIVIWEAFAKPPRPQIIGIGNNIRAPRKVKIKKPVMTSKSNIRMKTSATAVDRKTKSSESKKQPSVVEGSAAQRFFPSIKKKPKKSRKKKPKRIRPLAEAVSPRFFKLMADQKYKEIKYRKYTRIMETIKMRLNIKGTTDYPKIRADLKAVLAKCKKKKNVGHKGGRLARGTMKT